MNKCEQINRWRIRVCPTFSGSFYESSGDLHHAIIWESIRGVCEGQIRVWPLFSPWSLAGVSSRHQTGPRPLQSVYTCAWRSHSGAGIFTGWSKRLTCTWGSHQKHPQVSVQTRVSVRFGKPITNRVQKLCAGGNDTIISPLPVIIAFI